MSEKIYSSEKRRARRLRKKVRVFLFAGAESHEGEIVDISQTGVRILSTATKPAGEEIEVEISGPSDKLRLPAIVCWQREFSRAGSKWRSECGMRFASEHPDLPDFLFNHRGKPLSGYLDRISTIPIIILDLMAMLNDSRISMQEITKKISVDQVLVAYLLKVINSPLYGFHATINSISQCVSLLGYNNLKSLFMSYFTQQLSNIAGDKKIRESLWRHALYSALLARECARRQNLQEEEAYIAALLHDIGKPILIMLDSQLYQEALTLSLKEKRPLIEVEKELFGYSHDVLAGYLMYKWNLNILYSEAANFHHLPQEYLGTDRIILNTALANALAHAALDEGDPVPEEYWQKAGIDPAESEEIVAAIKPDIDSLF